MWLVLLLLSILALTSAEDVAQPSHPAVTKDNANHVFNSLHSSMRQWGSSWNHNGMSFFMARVPADTDLYHGSFQANPVTGLEWLAFEPEHALNFARFGGIRGSHADNQFRRPPQIAYGEHIQTGHHLQTPLHEARDNGSHDRPRPRPPIVWDPGFFHVYRTKHPLSLLYIDGTSAGKSNLGTLDSQDFALLNWTVDPSRSPMYGERDRADSYCKNAETKWNGHVDGVIRMEMGFEIILCDFEKHLDIVDILRSRNMSEIPYGSSPIWDETWAWYTGMAARYNGIGTNRVTLDYDDFVTAHTYPFNLYPNGTDQLPRLANLTYDELAQIRSDVDNMIHRHPRRPHKQPDHHPSRPMALSTNWQAVADMVVTRYSDAIPHFATISNLTTLQDGIKQLMRPFIDFSHRDIDAETTRCAHHFLPTKHTPRHQLHKYDDDRSPSPPPLLSDSTAAATILSVSHSICTTFFSILSLSDNTTTSTTTDNIIAEAALATAQSTLTNLTTYLDWTSWRTCPTKCAHDEVCFIPVWPTGTVEDRERGAGRCMNITGFHQRHGQSYWFRPKDGVRDVGGLEVVE